LANASQCYRSAWQYASSFNNSLPTPSAESHIAALHQALIPNWTSPQFSKFVDATRALVDELANITTTRDGKEEMVRCEEIFRQICWLGERFWPNVDGMGEENEAPRIGPQLAVRSTDNGTFTGPLNQNMNRPMSNNPMNGQMHSQRNGGMSGPVNNSAINGTMAHALNGAQMTAPMNGTINNAPMDSNESTPGPEDTNAYDQMSQMAQSS
jgi:hypothetical protein